MGVMNKKEPLSLIKSGSLGSYCKVLKKLAILLPVE
jgi:hypothetical protein